MFVTMEVPKDVCFYNSILILCIIGYFLSLLPWSPIRECIAVNTFILPLLFYGMSELL